MRATMLYQRSKWIQLITSRLGWRINRLLWISCNGSNLHACYFVKSESYLTHRNSVLIKLILPDDRKTARQPDWANRQGVLRLV